MRSNGCANGHRVGTSWFCVPIATMITTHTSMVFAKQTRWQRSSFLIVLLHRTRGRRNHPAGGGHLHCWGRPGQLAKLLGRHASANADQRGPSPRCAAGRNECGLGSDGRIRLLRAGRDAPPKRCANAMALSCSGYTLRGSSARTLILGRNQ